MWYPGTEPMLRFWNAENKHVSEAGEFTVSVGYADHMKFSLNGLGPIRF